MKTQMTFLSHKNDCLNSRKTLRVLSLNTIHFGVVMSVITIVYLFVGLILFESSQTIYRLHPKELLNKISASLILLFAVFCFTFGLFVTAQSREAAWILSKAHLILSCFMGSMILHFHLVLGNYEKLFSNRIILILLYSPALVLAGYAAVSPLAIVDIVMTPWGWDNVVENRSIFWNGLYLGYTIVFVTLGFISSIIKGLKTNDIIQKQQILSLIKANSIGFLLVIVTSAGMFYLNNTTAFIQTLVGDLSIATLILIWLAGLRYVMWKQKLFILLPQNSSKSLFSGVKTPILLTDEDDTVLFANDEAKKIITKTTEEPNGVTSVAIASLIENYQMLEKEITKLKTGRASHYNCNVRFINNPGEYYHLNIHAIRNEQDVFLGDLLMLNPAHGLESLRQKYGLTAKELEIVQLVDKGLSAPDMAQLLDRSELTIKTHISNIYRKTGIKNRVKLSQLVWK